MVTENQKKPRNVVFWVNFTYFIMLCLLIGVQILSKTVLSKHLSDLELDFVFALIVQIGIMFIIPLTAFSLIKRQKVGRTLKDFKVNKISFKHVLMSFGIGVCVFFLNLCVASFFNAIILALGYESLPSSAGSGISATFGNFLLVTFYSAMLPGICEEITHRGMLLNGLKKQGLAKALVLSSLMFGLMHLNINQFFYAFIVGLVIGFIAICANSIIPAMIVHFTNNFINNYLDFASVNGWCGGDFYNLVNSARESTEPLSVMLISILGITVVVTLFIFLIKKLLLERRGEQIDAKAREIVLNEMLSENVKNGDFSEMNPVVVAQNINEVKEKTLDLMLNKNKYLSFEMFNDEKDIQKPTLATNIFFYASIVMASVMTVFTFVWGVL